MSGNSTEEGLLLQLKNPSHVDPARFGFLAGGVVFLVVLLAVLTVVPGVPILLAICLGLGPAIVAAMLVSRRIAADRMAREVESLEAQRHAREAEAEEKIAAMKRGQ